MREAQVTLPPEVVTPLNRVEAELRQGETHLSPESRAWLSHTGLKVDGLMALLSPVPEIPAQQVHLYHCDHLGTPLALINRAGQADWQALADSWGTLLSEDNPGRLYQPLRMQGQQYDEETGLHYNRYRYYDPQTGRYISQDPIGLMGGWNLYAYPLDPVLGGIRWGVGFRCSGHT